MATLDTEQGLREHLRALRWRADDLITNDFGERVWLRPLLANGVRIGITDCCFEDDPCHRHASLAEGGRNQEPLDV